MSNRHNKLTKFHANNIINQTPDHKHKTEFPNTGAIGHYLKSDAPYCPSTNMGTLILVGFPSGQTMQSSNPCLLGFPYLPD